MAGAGVAGSLAAIALPASAQVSEIAAILALGSLALLAGHQWGTIVVVAADVVLLGRVWPLVVHDWPPSPEVQIAVYAALAGTLPGIFSLRRTVPESLKLLLGREPSDRAQAVGTFAACGLSAMWLAAPTLQWLL